MGAQLVDRQNHDREVAGVNPMSVEIFSVVSLSKVLYIWLAPVDLAEIKYQQIFLLNMSWESKNCKMFTGARHCTAFPNVLCKPPLTDLRISKGGI